MTAHPSDTSAIVTLLLIIAFGLAVLFWPSPEIAPSDKAPTSPLTVEGTANPTPDLQTPATD